MNVTDKTILITGGQRVGQHVARELAGSGAKLVMTYLKDAQEVAEIAAEVAAQTYQVDISQENSIKEFTAKLNADVGHINALINMASIFVPDTTPLQWSDMEKVFSVNSFGTMLLSNWFAEQAKTKQLKNAPIISFIDWALDHPYADHGVYLASKAAMRHYLMALQTTYAGTVRVINIHPGMILEPPNFPAAEKQEIITNTPVQEIGSPEQAAKLVRTALELDFWADNVYLAGGQQWRHRL